MMAIRRTASATRREFTDDQISHVSYGHDFFGGGWGLPPYSTEVLEEMAACWVGHRETIIEEYLTKWPGCRPWAYWQFDRPGERDTTRLQAEQLHGWGELSAEELLARRASDATRHYQEFRRSWSWWSDRGGRNWDITEAQQIVQLEDLTDWEKRVLASPGTCTTMLHLTERERVFLRLPVPKYGGYPLQQIFNHE